VGKQNGPENLGMEDQITGGPFKPFWLEWESKMGLKTQKWKIKSRVAHSSLFGLSGKAKWA
jgi:hypothetical protein